MLAGSLALAWLLRDLLFLLVVAVFFSYMLAPVVNAVENWLETRWRVKKAGKEIPLALVYVLMLVALGSLVALIGGMVLEQAGRLAEKLPELAKNREALLQLPLPSWMEPGRAAALEWIQGFVQGGFTQFLPMVQEMARKLVSGLGSASLFLMVPVFAFYFAKDGEELSAALIERFPARVRPAVEEIFGDLHNLLAQYIRALVLLSLATFVAYELFFAVTGVPYSILLAALAAVLEFVPVVGPLVAGGVAMAVAAFSGYPHLVWLLVFLLAYRMFQDYVLQPWLMSAGIELHPLLVLVGVLAGEQLAGLAGLFLAIPVVAALRIIYLKIEKTREA